MEYDEHMTASIWQRIKSYLPSLAAHLAVLAIGIPGVYIHFLRESPERWTVVGLVGAFGLLSILQHSRYPQVLGWFPLTYIVVQTIIVSVLLLISPGMMFFVIWYYVLSIEAIMMFPPRIGYAWIGMFVLLTIGILLYTLELDNAFVFLPIFLGGFFFFITFARATRQADEARKESQRLLEELQNAHRQLQEYAAQAEALAASEERNWLSREMHDTIGHRLTVAAVQLEGAK